MTHVSPPTDYFFTDTEYLTCRFVCCVCVCVYCVVWNYFSPCYIVLYFVKIYWLIFKPRGQTEAVHFFLNALLMCMLCVFIVVHCTMWFWQDIPGDGSSRCQSSGSRLPTPWHAVSSTGLSLSACLSVFISVTLCLLLVPRDSCIYDCKVKTFVLYLLAYFLHVVCPFWYNSGLQKLHSANDVAINLLEETMLVRWVS